MIMRFNKKSRKIRTKKKKTRKSGSYSFWGFLIAGFLLLGGFFFLLYSGHMKQVKKIHQFKIQEDMDRICVAAILFFQDHGRYPTTPEGIALLRSDRMPSSHSQPPSSRTGYIERVPRDPWRNPYIYKGPHDGIPLMLISLGADGKQGGTGEAADIIQERCSSTGLSAE